MSRLIELFLSRQIPALGFVDSGIYVQNAKLIFFDIVFVIAQYNYRVQAIMKSKVKS